MQMQCRHGLPPRSKWQGLHSCLFASIYVSKVLVYRGKRLLTCDINVLQLYNKKQAMTAEERYARSNLVQQNVSGGKRVVQSATRKAIGHQGLLKNGEFKPPHGRQRQNENDDIRHDVRDGLTDEVLS